MTYQMHLKLLCAKVERGVPFACDTLVLDVEYSYPAQQDGHIPSHGDMDRDFAEAIIRNIDRKLIACVLRSEGIKGINEIRGYTIKTSPDNVLSPTAFMPLFSMEIRIEFTPEKDEYMACANHLLGVITWQDAKEAVVGCHEHTDHLVVENRPMLLLQNKIVFRDESHENKLIRSGNSL